ncbi:MAG: radical SAM protein [Candidatus Cloacimonetes bacterium]|nr:radical SAM protein [Candidatus Cloacimonadota bacterium]
MSKTGSIIYPVFLPMQGCPGRCIYCDQQKISAATNPDPFSHIAEVAAFIRRNPGKSKEIAFYGASFTALSSAYRQQLLAAYAEIMDAQSSFRISTHPLFISDEILSECYHQGIRCIELGIQDFDSTVLCSSGRGYDHQLARDAAIKVKEHGFTLGVQLMPGLPGSDAGTIEFNMRQLVDILPHFLRLYPLVVIKGTELAKRYQQGTFRPLTLEEAIAICANYCELAEIHQIKVIKLGLPSNLDPAEILAGPFHPAFGEFVQAELLIRKLLKDYLPGHEIILDKKQRALLSGHGHRFHTILQDRLANCMNPLQP